MALRQGVDAPTSVVTIEIDPKILTQEERNLLADRMDGIDVRQRGLNYLRKDLELKTAHLTANLATFEALMAAVHANEKQCQRELESLKRPEGVNPGRFLDACFGSAHTLADLTSLMGLTTAARADDKQSSLTVHMPVVAKMPNGRFRLVWADPDAKKALELCESARAYVVEVQTEEEVERLQRLFSEELGGDIREN